jgi:nucleoside-diphosphate-sugar epimerase
VPRIAIAGCGYVGSALATLLAQRGNEVWGVRRSAAPPLPAGVVLLQADVMRPETLRWPASLDAVVYAVSPRESTAQAYHDAYITGLGHVLESLARQGQRPRRFILVSSTGVYGQNDGEQVDERSTAKPARPALQALLQGESHALKSGLPVTVVRFSGIYGPGRDRTVRSVLEGTARIQPGSRAVLNHIHRDDCAGAIAHLLSLTEAAPIYIGTDCEPVYKNDALRWIAARAGGEVREEDARSSAETSTRGGYRFLQNRLLLSSGYRFLYPTYREGYAALLNADKK